MLTANISVAPQAQVGSHWRHTAAGAVVLALGLLLPIAVVWSVQYPAQVDSYNHLARHYLELLHFQGKPLPPGFVVDYQILPNLGGDFVIPPLIWLFGPLPALKVYLTLSIMLHWFGAAMFILQTGRYTPSSWIASLLFLPLVVSSTFFWGFLNYYPGVGLAFLAAVHLRYLDRQEKPGVAALLVHATLVVSLFFCHLAAIFIYGLLLLALIVSKLFDTWRDGKQFVPVLVRAAVLCLPMLPAIALYLVYAAGQTHGPTELSWPPVLRKLLMVLSVFHQYDVRADVLVAVLWAMALLLFFGRSLLSGRAGFAAWATIILAVSYAVLPLQVGTTSGADSRMLPALVVCALAWLGTLRMRWSWVGVAVLTAAIGIRSADMAFAWQRLDARLSDEARSLAFIKPGSSVLPLILMTAPSKDHPENHFMCLAVIERGAYVPILFADQDQQPLRLTGETVLTSSDALLSYNPLTNDGRFMLPNPHEAANYDYLWIYNPVLAKLDLPPEWSRIFESEWVTLWQRHVSKGAAPGGS